MTDLAEYEDLRLRAAARLRLEEEEMRQLYQAHPWPFFEHRVRLIDPLASQGQQVADYPRFPYCEKLIREFHTHLQIIVWKARRMIVSWSAIDYCVWLASHFPNQRIFLISRVEGDNASEGARELIWRAAWTVKNLRDGPRIRIDDTKLQITFPDTGSIITGMGGNEPNKMRQVAANVVFLDEFGFWEKPEEAFRALRPTLEGRGKVIIACSTASGYFKQIVYDESGSWMEHQMQRDRPQKVADHVEYLPGMEAWTNPGNGFRVIKLYPWADPRKHCAESPSPDAQGLEWERKERAGMTQRAWEQEYLLKFNVAAGRPVFLHEWDEKRMVFTPDAEELEARSYRPLIVSLDFGYNRPCVVVSYFQAARIWKILRAHMGHQIHFTPFMRQVQVLLAEWFPEHQGGFLWCCDAAGKHEGSDAEPEVVTLRKKFAIKPRFKWSLIAPTIDRMRDYMSDVHRGQPCFQVERHPTTRLILDALNGGYRYPEAKAGHPEPEEPEKDGFYDHPMDALRYAALNFGGSKLQRTTDLAAVAKRDIIPPQRYVVR